MDSPRVAEAQMLSILNTNRLWSDRQGEPGKKCSAIGERWGRRRSTRPSRKVTAVAGLADGEGQSRGSGTAARSKDVRERLWDWFRNLISGVGIEKSDFGCNSKVAAAGSRHLHGAWGRRIASRSSRPQREKAACRETNKATRQM